MKNIILEKLKALERDANIRILYACESGSRAWGFASPDSDYDVRFIYVHEKEFYLSIDEKRDVIELPINAVLDIGGWDLRKALRLFRKSNASLYEWLQSPVIYLADDSFMQEIRESMSSYFSPRAGMHHYLSMAKGVMRDELSKSEVKLKKYFYALRPILACRWIADRGQLPPMEFGALRQLLPNHLNGIVDDLLEKKAVNDEKFLIAACEQLNVYIQDQINFCEAIVPPAEISGDNEQLSQLFRHYLV